MNLLLLILLATLALSLAVQAWLVWGFVHCLAHTEGALLTDSECQPAIVVLCLRGDDPFLSQCLDGLLQQDYPQYRVVLVVDHPTDPSMQVVRQVLASHTSDICEVEYLREPLSTCSLKCASLAQVAAKYQDRVHFMAQLDADAIPHRTWLRELATALGPEAIGAATGNRWYMPNRLSAGAVVRYTWNAAAVVQMYWYNIAWGGTLAIKTSAVRDAGLIELWRAALCEDTMLSRQLARIGCGVAFVPSLMMINREDCQLRPLIPWVTRQMLTAKLYHPAWMAIAFHGISSLAILVAGWGWGCVLLVQGAWWSASQVIGAMITFQIGLAALIPWIEYSVARIVSARGQETQWRHRLTPMKLLAAVVMTQWFYSWALLKSMTIRCVEWRGITYQINGPWQIRMQQYAPYMSTSKSSEPNEHSL